MPTIEELILERRENGTILASVNEAINRAGIHCAVTYSEAIGMIAAQRLSEQDKTLVKICVRFRIKELNEAIERCLRRGSSAQLDAMRLTGKEAEAEADRLYELLGRLM